MVDVNALVAAVRAVVGTHAPPLPLHGPEFRGREKDYVLDCIDSTFVSSVGAWVDRFEAMLAEVTGAAHAVAVVNGTAALQVALRLVGVGRDDEVIMPAFSFVATANAAAYLGAVPHFVDVSPVTLGLCPSAVARRLESVAERVGGNWRNRETGRRIGAVVPMHTFGHPIDLDGLSSALQPYGLPVVEDAAEALGSSLCGRALGRFGLVGALSFNGNKIVTTGGGGAMLFEDAELAARARHLTTTAKAPHRWAYVHDDLGYNFRMPNLNAALGCAQLERLEAMVASKRALTERYAQALEAVSGVALFREPPGAVSNYWLQCVLLDAADAQEPALEALHAAGVLARPAWAPLSSLPMYRDCPSDALGVTRDLAGRVINLPSSSWLEAA